MSSTEAAPRHGSAHQSHPWGFVVPAFAVLAVFFLTPTIYNFIYAFTDWSSFKTTINPVGWSNFSDLIASGSLRKSLIITLIYAAGVAALQNLFGLMLAVPVSYTHLPSPRDSRQQDRPGDLFYPCDPLGASDWLHLPSVAAPRRRAQPDARNTHRISGKSLLAGIDDVDSARVHCHSLVEVDGHVDARVPGRA